MQPYFIVPIAVEYIPRYFGVKMAGATCPPSWQSAVQQIVNGKKKRKKRKCN